MNTVAFDTLAFAKRLQAAGMSSELAEAQASAQAEFLDQHILSKMATKEDLRREIEGLRKELKTDIEGLHKELKTDIEGLRKELKTDIEGLRKELKNEIEGLRKDTNAANEGLRKELKNDIEGLRKDTNAANEGLRKELKNDIEGLRKDMDIRLSQMENRQTLRMLAMIGSLAAFIALIEFVL